MVALLVGVGAIVVVRRPPTSPPRPPKASIDPWRQTGFEADAAAASQRLFVAPTGDGDRCTTDEPCSLTGARDAARSLTATQDRDVVVQLAGGTYPQDEPFTIGSEDSGRNGHLVRYQAAPGETPVLDGGRRITGWTIDDPDRGIWSAPIDPSVESRQLFVDGVRATRARGPDRPPGWERTPTGFRAPDDAMARWANPTDVEIVSFREWKAMRCPIASISGRDITMAQPCWKNVNAHDPNTTEEVTWIENAQELLDEPGEWYLDRAEGRVRYRPRPGQDLATADVVVPTTTTLLHLRGSVDAPVHDVSFEGLTFAHTTWLTPSTPKGYPVTQAGWFLTGDADPPDERDLGRADGAVSVAYATHVRFERGSFRQLGGSGLDLQTGSQDVGVVGSRFDDIAGNGIQVGETRIFADRPSDQRDRLDRIEVSNDVVTRAGADYPDAVGIFVSYASNVSILHDEVHDLPYTGISLGWGWGTDSYATHNVIRSNHVHDVLRTLTDGGAIYTLSAQPDSMIDHNYVHDQGHLNGALYLDEGSRHLTVQDNVVAHAPRWLHIWTDTIRDDVVVDNFSDTDELMNKGTNIVVADNVEGLTAWPPAAEAIIDQAGLEPAFRS